MKVILPKYNINRNLLQYYEEYKTFINYTNLQINLPEFKDITLKLFDCKNSSNQNLATVYPPTDNNSFFSLRLEKNLFSALVEHARPILYHEFTHILDYSNICTNHDYKTQNMLLGLFTEFHASKVQLMSSLDFTNITAKETIHLSNKIFDIDKHISLEEYLSSKKKDISINYEILKSKSNPQYLKEYLDHIMYYFGELSLCMDFCEEDLSRFLNFSPITNILGIEVKNIFDLLISRQNITEDILIEITKNRIAIMKNFQ